MNFFNVYALHLPRISCSELWYMMVMLIQIVCGVYIIIIDIAYHKIPYSCIYILMITLIVSSVYYELSCACLGAAGLALILYYLGFKFKKVGGGDVKLAPLLAGINIIGISSTLVDHPVVTLVDSFMIDPKANMVFMVGFVTFSWMLLSQILTVAALYVRRVIMKISIFRPIAHGPAMVLSSFTLWMLFWL